MYFAARVFENGCGERYPGIFEGSKRSCAGWRIASERAGVGFAGGVKNLLVGCRATSQGLECAEAEGMVKMPESWRAISEDEGEGL